MLRFLIVVQLLRQLSFSPVVVYASSAYESYLRELGATHIIDRHSVSFADLPSTVSNILSNTTSSPLKVVFDAFSSYEAQKAAYDSLADGGDMIIVNQERLKTEDKVGNEKKVLAVVGTVHFPHTKEWGAQLWKVLSKWVEDGVIVVGLFLLVIDACQTEVFPR